VEKYRIVYYDTELVEGEAIIVAESAEAAIGQIENLGRLCGAGVTSLGPVEPESDEQGSASYPWGSREQRLAEQSGPDA
jgi:hypothetical protein